MCHLKLARGLHTLCTLTPLAMGAHVLVPEVLKGHIMSFLHLVSTRLLLELE